MTAPRVSGIYIATLHSDEFVPVTRDARYVEVCARVNHSNVKIGKAIDLAKRETDYWRDFGRKNVSFIPIAKTDLPVEAERVAREALRSYRLRSPKNGLMDWLENISADEVVEKILSAMVEAEIPYERI